MCWPARQRGTERGDRTMQSELDAMEKVKRLITAIYHAEQGTTPFACPHT